MLRYTTLLALFAAALASAQTTTNSITVTATRTNTAQPDQVTFLVSVNAPPTVSLTDAVAALQGTGIVLANFTSVYTTQTYNGKQYITMLEWTFNLTVPLTNMKPTIDTFTGLQMSLSKAGSALSVSFSVQGTSVSPQAQAAQPCSLSGLISDARAQATTIATAASKTVGSILALSNSTSDSTPVCSATVTFALGAGF